MRIAVGSDHRGVELRAKLIGFLQGLGQEVVDMGVDNTQEVDYPDDAALVARKVASQEVERGIAVCGSGVGASVAANKVTGVRAALINDHFSAHQGVEDDDLNLLCLGGRVTGNMAAQELVEAFLNARFTGEERHLRRLGKVKALEK